MPERRTVAAKGITRRETEGARVTWMSCRTYRGPRRKRFTEKFFVRCDVTEEFPFLVTKFSPYYDR